MSTSVQNPDAQLVRAYLDGDDSAFDSLYRRYYPDITRYLYGRTQDLTLAEDVAQETMLRALRYLRTYDQTKPLWPWLRKIAMNMLATERQRYSAEILVEEVDRGVATFPDGTDAVVSRDAVMACLAKLPKRQQRALIMRYVEDRDSNDIAALFDLTRNAVEQLMLRGKNSFKKEYRVQNPAPLLPGFAAVAARVRRIVHGFEARVATAANTPLSVASDIAIGAALTVSGFGIVVGGLQASPAEAVEAKDGAARATGAPAEARSAAATAGAAIDAAAANATAPTTGANVLVATAPQGEAPSDTGSAAVAEGSAADTTATTAATPPDVSVDTPAAPEQPDVYRMPKTPPAPEPEPTDSTLYREVGVEDTAEATVATGASGDGTDGADGTIQIELVLLGEEHEFENNSHITDNNLCLTALCDI